jgi:hypothetical protein
MLQSMVSTRACLSLLALAAALFSGCGGKHPADYVDETSAQELPAGVGGSVAATGGSGGGDPVATGGATADGPTGGSAGTSTQEPTKEEGMRLGTNFWFLADWGERAWADNATFTTTSNPWNPTFVSEITQSSFAVLRFMDFGGTNNSVIRNWPDRTQQASDANLRGGDVGGRGIAYEWMFDLCNRTGKDCWICLPHLTIETYEANPSANFFTELARLAKDKLLPERRIYVEYSNETWNGQFSQFDYVAGRGRALGYSDQAYTASFYFHVYAALRIQKAFEEVFAEAKDRVKVVLAGQLGSHWGSERQVEALKNGSINPWGLTPDYHAVSNYVGNGINGASSSIRTDWSREVSAVRTSARRHRDIIAPTGMQLIAYEGGQHIVENADVFSRNPQAYDMYKEWLEAVRDDYVLTVHYAYSGAYGSGGAWGSKEYVGQPLTQAPKARALGEFVSGR